MWNESRNESITGTDIIPCKYCKSRQPLTSLSIQGHVPQAPSTTGYPGWMEIQTAISFTCLPHADARVYGIHEIHQFIHYIYNLYNINAEVDVIDAIGRLGFCEKQRFGFLVPTSLDELGL